MLCFVFMVLLLGVNSKIEELKFDSNCLNLNCKSNGKVCGLRSEGEAFKLRLFQDECERLKYNCIVKDNFAYDVTEIFYCLQTFHPKTNLDKSVSDSCEKFDCPLSTDDAPVCGLKEDGTGFRIRIFRNRCKLLEHNCVSNANFKITDLYICKDLRLPDNGKNYPIPSNEMPSIINTDPEEIIYESEIQNNRRDEDDNFETDAIKILDKPNINDSKDDFYIAMGDFNEGFNENDHYANLEDYYMTEEPINHGSKDNENTESKPKRKGPKNVVVIRGLLQNNDVNKTIDRFFAATHVQKLPLRKMPTEQLNENTRRRHIKIARPLSIYIPQLIIPPHIKNDDDHMPTLQSCFHKCPRKCPSTYAPVCGKAGRIALEPSLTFLNHCYMDVAQCKQWWENESPTSRSSGYTETNFVFCLGESMYHMYQFLPLVKTLQHIGRLPKKGRYHYRLSNLKIFNNYLNVKNPNPMG